MVSCNVTTVTVDTLPLLTQFLAQAGDLGGFRYFDKRPVEVVLDHLLCIIISFNGQPVAYGHLDQEAEKVWLGVAVTEAARGQGWGSFTVRTLIQAARVAGIPELTLSVDIDNIGARRIYEKLGFTTTSTHEYYVLMKKKIHG